MRQVPAARQGPGRVPWSLVEGLDLVIARRASGALPGDRTAAGLGSGTELAQLRPYEVGDDVRQLDPAASARTGVPHVRLQVPERTLTTWLAVDVSPSMGFGTADRLKSDVAEGAAEVLGRLATRRAGRLAVLAFGAGRANLTRPRGSRPAIVALRRVIGDGIAADGGVDRHALAHALQRLGKVARQPGLVIIISDFRDQDEWLRPMGLLRSRHSVLAIEVRDPREATLPAVGRLAVVDPETGQHVEIDTSRRVVRERFAAIEAAGRAEVARELRRLEVNHVVLSTEGDWMRELGRRLR